MEITGKNLEEAISLAIDAGCPIVRQRIYGRYQGKPVHSWGNTVPVDVEIRVLRDLYDAFIMIGWNESDIPADLGECEYTDPKSIQCEPLVWFFEDHSFITEEEISEGLWDLEVER